MSPEDSCIPHLCIRSVRDGMTRWLVESDRKHWLREVVEMRREKVLVRRLPISLGL